MAASLSRWRRLGPIVAGISVVVACRQSDQPNRDPAHVHSVGQDLIAPDQFFTGTDLPDQTLILTFDDGPSPLAVAGELTTWLKNRPVPIHATFFLNGACIAPTALPNESCDTPTPDALAVIAKELADGHLIGNHTTTHRDLTTLGASEIVEELTDTDAVIGSYLPWNQMLFRAPYGNWDSSVYAALATTPMNKYVGPIYWNIGGGPTDTTRAADWECWQDGYTTRQCGDLYLIETRELRRGIVLMHDRYGDTDNHDLDNGTGNTIDMVKYIIPTLESEGYTFKATWEDPAIAAALPACKTCGAGSYASAACSATADTTCTPCAACPDGKYASTTCSATTNTTCAACDAACATCSGPGPSACLTCAAGSFLVGSTCTACKACGAGFYQETACGAAADTVCGACDPSCTVCAGPAKAQCGTCLPGFHIADNACKACTTCPPGTFASGACTVATDSVCTPCAAGSSSAKANSATCTACETGTFAAASGASTCSSCGSCDDGDTCTTDDCAPAAGCIHTRKQGCGADADADGGTPSDTAASSASGCSVAGPRQRPRPRAGASDRFGSNGFAWLLAAIGIASRARRRRPTGRGPMARTLAVLIFR